MIVKDALSIALNYSSISSLFVVKSLFRFKGVEVLRDSSDAKRAHVKCQCWKLAIEKRKARFEYGFNKNLAFPTRVMSSSTVLVGSACWSNVGGDDDDDNDAIDDDGVETVLSPPQKQTSGCPATDRYVVS